MLRGIKQQNCDAILFVGLLKFILGSKAKGNKATEL